MAKYGYIKLSLADSVMKLPIEVDFRVEDHKYGSGNLSQAVYNKHYEKAGT